MQHHYVIVFDDIANRWSHATDMEEDAFYDGTVYDTVERVWTSPYLGNEVFIPNEEESIAKVSLMINQLNGEQ